MNILMYVTKRSMRDVEKKRFSYTSAQYTPGDVIEIIEARRKSLAIILDCKPASNYKQALRSGEIKPDRLSFSKSGIYSDGYIVKNFDIKYIKKCLNGKELLISDLDGLKNFVPKKKPKKKAKIKETPRSYDLKNLDVEMYKNRSSGHATQMHEMVDEIRNYFGERARYGEGSFSYYLGFFKRVPLYQVEQYFAEVKQTKKSTLDKKKLFWWKMGQYFKDKKK